VLNGWSNIGKQVNWNSEGASLDREKPLSSALPGSKEQVSSATDVGRGDRELSFAGFRLQADGTLLRGEAVVHLPPKELAALRLLVAHAGQIVSPLELRQALWGDVHVTDDSVPKCLSSLRARLGPEQCIQTVYKRGYRFSAEVRPLVAAPVNALPRLAILPFATGHGIPEHLGLAVAEETIGRLSNAHPASVTVLARDSVFMLASQGLSAQQIGESLKADLVLAGTLRALPSHFRLRAEMIRVEDGAQIWVEDLIVPQSRIAGLESELGDRLAFRLHSGALSISAAAATGSEFDRSSQEPGVASWDGRNDRTLEGNQTPTSSLGSNRREAYELYQRAHHEWQTLQRHRMQDSLQLLLRATELDPLLIAAKVDLAHLCITQAFYGFMSPAVAAYMIRRTAKSGFQETGVTEKGLGRRGDESVFDLPFHAEAILPALGWINFHVDRDLPAALQAFSASAYLPHDPWITRVRSMFALSRHRFAEAIAILRAALLHDPFAPWLHARLAWALHLAGQADESVRQIRQTLALFPEHEGASLYGAMILAFHGDAAEAAELAQGLVQRSPYFDLAGAVRGYALACAGRADEARTILERLEWLSRERFVLNAFHPAVHVALGNLDAAISELRAANESRCPWFFQMLADPRLKPLHRSPEFVEMQGILTRMEAEAAENPAPEG
jgi:DNA-binding winged helix-turn-helix (wHTH) protein/tetratricopeptide (TPR) repeat protein